MRYKIIYVMMCGEFRDAETADPVFSILLNFCN